jgi:hypothetical protein
MPLTTPSGGLTKLGDFEHHVKGTMPAHEMYAIANRIGLMHGNKATERGGLAATFGHGSHHAVGGSPGLGGLTHLQMGGLGGMSLGMMERAENREEVDMPHGGFLNSGVAGRTDRIPASVAADSFVIPAAEVSGLGQGNSLAGSRLWSMALGVGPYGTRPAQAVRGPGPPPHHPPSLPGAAREVESSYSRGGREPQKASVLLAGGEMVVEPPDVQRIGGGDMQEGHRLMRQAVKIVREHNIKRLKVLPMPKK